MSKPVYIVAEMSANHLRDLDTAVKIVRAAKQAGADAVKLQTYTPETMTLSSDHPHFRVGAGNPWEGQTLYELYSKAATPWEWHPKLKNLADQIGLDFFSTPFDFSAVDFLETLNVPAYKIASFELVDIPLLEYAAKKGKPMILSTGMATLSEIEEAVQAVRNAGNDQIVLLKCTSAYPAPAEEMNLRSLTELSRKFDVSVGLSDHTLGTAVAVAAVALGASVIEKHLTLSRGAGGPDASFSMEPGEFQEMARQIRQVEAALGKVSFEPTPKEESSRIFRRSLFVVADVNPGDTLTPQNVRSIRPGNGLHPRHYREVLGKKFVTRVQRGTPLDWTLIR